MSSYRETVVAGEELLVSDADILRWQLMALANQRWRAGLERCLQTAQFYVYCRRNKRRTSLRVHRGTPEGKVLFYATGKWRGTQLEMEALMELVLEELNYVDFLDDIREGLVIDEINVAW